MHISIINSNKFSYILLISFNPFGSASTHLDDLLVLFAMTSGTSDDFSHDFMFCWFHTWEFLSSISMFVHPLQFESPHEFIFLVLESWIKSGIFSFFSGFFGVETRIYLLVLDFLLHQLLHWTRIFNWLLFFEHFDLYHLFILFNCHSTLYQFKESWMIIVVRVKWVLNYKCTSMSERLSIHLFFFFEKDNTLFKNFHFF